MVPYLTNRRRNGTQDLVSAGTPPPPPCATSPSLWEPNPAGSLGREWKSSEVFRAPDCVCRICITPSPSQPRKAPSLSDLGTDMGPTHQQPLIYVHTSNDRSLGQVSVPGRTVKFGTRVSARPEIVIEVPGDPLPLKHKVEQKPQRPTSP